jgi:AmiR/NasT family two-component response regulator
VQVALQLAEKPPLRPIAWPGAPAGSVFDVPPIPGWERATEGLIHPHTGRRRPITFDHAVANGRDDIVLAHLNHRLVQMGLRILRAEVWALDDRKTLHRVAIRRSADPSLAHPVVAVCSRLVVTGGCHHQLHEELTLAGGELRADGFARITQVGRLDTLVDQAIAHEPTAVVFADLRTRFDRHHEAIRAATEARSRERLKILENTLGRRKQGDIADITGLLAELATCIQKELDESKETQLEFALWPENERQQLRRDVAALQARLARIPEERAQEIAAIERRYSGFAHRTFPVAVIFIVPL